MAKFSSAALFDLKDPPPWQNCCYCSSSSSPLSSVSSATQQQEQQQQQWKTSDGTRFEVPVSGSNSSKVAPNSLQPTTAQSLIVFKTPADFVRHLRQHHCTVEGGSYVCRYGYNGVCSSLPLDGVSDRDYEMHVHRCHVNQQQKESQIKWSVFSAAQNLPAVLNDPSRSKQTNFFTKKWGDNFVEQQSTGTSSQLPEIKWDHFDFYLKRIGKRYRVHTRVSKTALPQVGASQQNQQPIVSDRLPNGGTANLKDIPEVFLTQDMKLHSPASFAAVFPGIGNDGEQAKQSSRLLQEKLSHYLDIVEVLIAKQVAEKSSAFFHAMTSQDAIMEQMREAVAHVSRLRSRLKLLDDTVVRESLQIMSLERTRSNNNLVLERLKLMSTVHQTQPMIQLLLSTQDYVAALDLIGTTQEILSQELVGVHCFRHLPSQLNEMERLIDKMLTTDFERYSTADLNRPLAKENGFEAVEKVLEEDKLICIISGLLRKGSLDFIDTYKEEAITTVRAVVKQLVIEVIASGEAEVCLTGAGEEAQSLSLSEWIILLESATITLLKLLKRVRAVHDVMQQTADASAGKLTDDVTFMDTEAFLSSKDHEVVQTKLSNLLQSVCNYCHERCANLVSNQSLEKSSVSAEQIQQLTEIVERFSDGCEKVCGIQSVPLKMALRTQGNRFAQKFHSERKSKLALLLDSERWKQAEVPTEFQTMVDNISKGNFMWRTKVDQNGVPVISNAPQSMLLVEGKPFALVGAALLLVQIVGEYCRCASQLPVVAPQLSWNVIDLLRTFNSRSCQLVLGAGALHVAGLKTITSGNLALVSRALQLVLWLLPHVKSHFQSLETNNQTSSTNILTGYDSVEKDFASHIKEIENKVLVIICDAVSGQMANWDARPPVPSQSFRNISRQFVKLHEAIAPILPEKEVATIYRVVHKSFKDKLREQLLRNNIVNNGGPQHGTVVSELTFYMETLKALKVLPDEELSDATLNDIWLK
ncbi:vacuolar protein sorting-associated protein 54 [Uranotaenia lowii]|uniref:vacuolar protein sorting-associated protein 54 n=1 Tax=Uranotaenia lowii TaxID=190385 RepID=UPI0024798EE6|nr:vacuolar protein sorting-associated protein 54 [Uranotaenia lowii]XP_055593084.1 vacuolar protein sorting-associated protein 54 [Uranotaenia lowii]XP_055593085.1 vacuolar protein sorting-associated protein 54 [Uranotaenia lowii]